MDSDPPPGAEAGKTPSDAGSARPSAGVRLAVAVVFSGILGFIGRLADVSALIDKVHGDGIFSLVEIGVVFAVIVVIAAVIGVGRHYKVLTVARLRGVAAAVVAACAGFLIGHFLPGTDVADPPPKTPGSATQSLSAQPPLPPPTSSSPPTSTPMPSSDRRPSTPGPRVSTTTPGPTTPPTTTPPPPLPPATITTRGSIAAPAEGSGVQKCALVTGTARLAAGRTLILAVRNLDNDQPNRWYAQFPRRWNEPSTLSTWEGVEYFPGDLKQHYEIGLFAVGLKAAVSAHAAGQAATDDLVPGATPLDTRKVIQRDGGSGSDCD